MVQVAQTAESNLVRADPEYYSTPRDPALITFPALLFLPIAGRGAPDSAAFQAAFPVIFAAANTLKSSSKNRGAARTSPSRRSKGCSGPGPDWYPRCRSSISRNVSGAGRSSLPSRPVLPRVHAPISPDTSPRKEAVCLPI